MSEMASLVFNSLIKVLSKAEKRSSALKSFEKSTQWTEAERDEAWDEVLRPHIQPIPATPSLKRPRRATQFVDYTERSEEDFEDFEDDPDSHEVPTYLSVENEGGDSDSVDVVSDALDYLELKVADDILFPSLGSESRHLLISQIFHCADHNSKMKYAKRILKVRQKPEPEALGMLEQLALNYKHHVLLAMLAQTGSRTISQPKPVGASSPLQEESDQDSSTTYSESSGRSASFVTKVYDRQKSKSAISGKTCISATRPVTATRLRELMKARKYELGEACHIFPHNLFENRIDSRSRKEFKRHSKAALKIHFPNSDIQKLLDDSFKLDDPSNDILLGKVHHGNMDKGLEALVPVVLFVRFSISHSEASGFKKDENDSTKYMLIAVAPHENVNGRDYFCCPIEKGIDLRYSDSKISGPNPDFLAAHASVVIGLAASGCSFGTM